MKKLLIIVGGLLILSALAYACDYEGVLCGSANAENASADTTGMEGKN